MTCPRCDGWRVIRTPGLAPGVSHLKPCPACLPGRAADRLAALDFAPGDSPSVDQVFGSFPESGFAWPEPGEECLDVLATTQLYWPLETPTAVRRSE